MWHPFTFLLHVQILDNFLNSLLALTYYSLQERLEREYNLSLITTAPSVVYRVHCINGETVSSEPLPQFSFKLYFKNVARKLMLYYSWLCLWSRRNPGVLIKLIATNLHCLAAFLLYSMHHPWCFSFEGKGRDVNASLHKKISYLKKSNEKKPNIIYCGGSKYL